MKPSVHSAQETPPERFVLLELVVLIYFFVLDMVKNT